MFLTRYTTYLLRYYFNSERIMRFLNSMIFRFLRTDKTYYNRTVWTVHWPNDVFYRWTVAAWLQLTRYLKFGRHFVVRSRNYTDFRTRSSSKPQTVIIIIMHCIVLYITRIARIRISLWQFISYRWYKVVKIPVNRFYLRILYVNNKLWKIWGDLHT